MSSFVPILLQEGFEFCYTQQPNIKGISRESIKKRWKVYKPAILINYFKHKYDIELVFNSEDNNYLYVAVN